MCFLGRPVPAERLYPAGVVIAVAAPGQAAAEAETFATSLAAGPLRAIGRIKSQIASTPGNDLATQLALEAKAINAARSATSGCAIRNCVDRDFYAETPDKLWVADLTYGSTWTGFLYLAVALDGYSRRIVS